MWLCRLSVSIPGPAEELGKECLIKMLGLMVTAKTVETFCAR